MIAEVSGFHVPITVSLTDILLSLAVAVLASVIFGRRQAAEALGNIWHQHRKEHPYATAPEKVRGDQRGMAGGIGLLKIVLLGGTGYLIYATSNGLAVIPMTKTDIVDSFTKQPII